MTRYVSITRQDGRHLQRDGFASGGFCYQNRKSIRQVAKIAVTHITVNDPERCGRYMMGGNDILPNGDTVPVPGEARGADGARGRPLGVTAMPESYRCGQRSVSSESSSPSLLAIFEVLDSFFGDNVVRVVFFEAIDETFLGHFTKVSDDAFVAESDPLSFHVDINRTRGKCQPSFCEKSENTLATLLLSHWRGVARARTYLLRTCHFGLTDDQEIISIPSWEYLWTSFNIYRLIDKVTTANRSQGAPSGRIQNGPEWDRVRGRADPMQDPHDRGWINNCHPQKTAEPTHNYAVATEVAAA